MAHPRIRLALRVVTYITTAINIKHVKIYYEDRVTIHNTKQQRYCYQLWQYVNCEIVQNFTAGYKFGKHMFQFHCCHPVLLQ